MKKDLKARLALVRTTIRTLSSDNLGKVKGGAAAMMAQADSDQQALYCTHQCYFHYTCIPD